MRFSSQIDEDNIILNARIDCYTTNETKYTLRSVAVIDSDHFRLKVTY